VDGVEPWAAEARDRGEDMGVGEIGLGMLGPPAAERLDPPALDAGDRDAGVRMAMDHGEPVHARRLHRRLHDVAVAEPGGHPRDEGIERGGVVTQAHRPTAGSGVVEHPDDGVAANGEVDADGSGCHREDPSGRSNLTPQARPGRPSATATAETVTLRSCHAGPVGAAGSDRLRHGHETIR